MSYHCYADDTQLFLSFPPSDTQVSNRFSACLRDIQSWMDNHHLKLNPHKTELIFFPALNSPFSDFSTVTSSPSARNLGVVMDNRLSLSENITAVTRTCRFFLYNIRRIRPFLTTYSTQLLVQAMFLSRLDYCNSLLAGLPASAIRPLQLIQNAAARLIFHAPKYTHSTGYSLTSTGCQIQDIGACIPGSQGISPRLHPTAHPNLHTGQSSMLRYLWTSGTPRPSHLHSSFTTALCSGPTMVE